MRFAGRAAYLRIADDLRRRLAEQEWEPGERLPSRARMAEEYQVAPSIVQRGQEVLIDEGLLEGFAGSGVFVKQPTTPGRINRTSRGRLGTGSPFAVRMRRLNLSPAWDARSEPKTPATPDVARRLGIAEGDPTVRTTYEYLADSKPVQLATSWEPMAVTGRTIVVLPEDGPLRGRGVVDRMAEIGVTVTRAVEVPRPRALTERESLLLGTSRRTLALCIERTYYDSDGRAVETADLIVPADRWEVAYDLPIDPS